MAKKLPQADPTPNHKPRGGTDTKRQRGLVSASTLCTQEERDLWHAAAKVQHEAGELERTGNAGLLGPWMRQVLTQQARKVVDKDSGKKQKRCETS